MYILMILLARQIFCFVVGLGKGSGEYSIAFLFWLDQIMEKEWSGYA